MKLTPIANPLILSSYMHATCHTYHLPSIFPPFSLPPLPPPSFLLLHFLPLPLISSSSLHILPCISLFILLPSPPLLSSAVHPQFTKRAVDHAPTEKNILHLQLRLRKHQARTWILQKVVSDTVTIHVSEDIRTLSTCIRTLYT